MTFSFVLDDHLPLDQYFKNTMKGFIFNGRMDMDFNEVTYWIMNSLYKNFPPKEQLKSEDYDFIFNLSNRYTKEMERIGVFEKGKIFYSASNGLMSYFESNNYKNSIQEVKNIKADYSKNNPNIKYFKSQVEKIYDKSMSDLKMYV